MKRLGILLGLAVFLSGCATMTASTLTANNRLNLVHLKRGMPKAKVLAIMKSGTRVYSCDQAATKVLPKVTINNPYRTEMIETSGRTLEVVYYVTSLDNNDCAINESELTPLVFEDGKLIGWGATFLCELVPAMQKQKDNQQAMDLKQADSTTQAPAQEPMESNPEPKVNPLK
jgi:hypothetical protein